MGSSRRSLDKHSTVSHKSSIKSLDKYSVFSHKSSRRSLDKYSAVSHKLSRRSLDKHSISYKSSIKYQSVSQCTRKSLDEFSLGGHNDLSLINLNKEEVVSLYSSSQSHKQMSHVSENKKIYDGKNVKKDDDDKSDDALHLPSDSLSHCEEFNFGLHVSKEGLSSPQRVLEHKNTGSISSQISDTLLSEKKSPLSKEEKQKKDDENLEYVHSHISKKVSPLSKDKRQKKDEELSTKKKDEDLEPEQFKDFESIFRQTRADTEEQNEKEKREKRLQLRRERRAKMEKLRR